MAGFFELNQLAARKRALVAESEAYRQELMLELHQLQIYASGWRRRLRFFSVLQPLLVLLPILVPLVRGRLVSKESKPKAGRWQRLLKFGLLGWRLSRQYAPLVGQFMHRARS